MFVHSYQFYFNSTRMSQEIELQGLQAATRDDLAVAFQTLNVEISYKPWRIDACEGAARLDVEEYKDCSRAIKDIFGNTQSRLMFGKSLLANIG